jgi:hypothetical protein
MYELWSKFNPDEFIGLVAVTGAMLCGLVCGTTAIVMGCWLEMRRTATAAALKRDMLDRGMSAEDIRVVVEAGSKQSRKACRRAMVATPGPDRARF